MMNQVLKMLAIHLKCSGTCPDTFRQKQYVSRKLACGLHTATAYGNQHLVPFYSQVQTGNTPQ